MNNQVPSNIALEELLKIGCYHELGHILASFLFLRDYEIALGIRLSRNKNGSFGLDVPTEFNSFPIQKEIHNYALYCICGGIFQQIKEFAKKFESGGLDYSDEEREISIQNSKDAFCLYCHRVTKSYIIEMEIDYDSLKGYENVLSSRGIKVDYDYESIKHEAIDILMPYVFDKGIDSTCDACVKLFLKQINARGPFPYTIETQVFEPLLNLCIEKHSKVNNSH